MKYPRSIYRLLFKGVLRPTGATLIVLLLAYVIIYILPESIKPPRTDTLRLFWLWQIAAILHNFAAYWRFSKEAHPVFYTETKKTLDIVFILGIAALFLWTVAYPFVRAALKPDSFMFKASIELATWCLMCAYLFVNSTTLYVLDKRINVVKSDGPIDELDIRYSQLLRRTIVQVDMPCIVPFTIILVYAVLNQSGMNWETYVLGASAILLFVSNILSSVLTTLWEEECDVRQELVGEPIQTQHNVGSFR